jgi:hypothetical protein
VVILNKEVALCAVTLTPQDAETKNEKTDNPLGSEEETIKSI